MGELIEGYGQFGSGVPTKSHREGGYDNSFIIADPHEAWVLEAVGKRWAARCTSHGYTSISNQPSIRDQWDLASRDLRAFAVEQGWWSDDAQASFDFARAYMTSACRARSLTSGRRATTMPPRRRSRQLDEAHRDHYEDTWYPYFDADPDSTLCMHVQTCRFYSGNTAILCVAVLPKSRRAAGLW
jgi:secernin